MDKWKAKSVYGNKKVYIDCGSINIGQTHTEEAAEQIVKEHNLYPELVEELIAIYKKHGYASTQQVLLKTIGESEIRKIGGFVKINKVKEEDE